MPRSKITRIIQWLLWGDGRKPCSLKKQITRLIVICCIGAVTAQAVVMLAMILKQYIGQKKEDTLYMLESANVEMDKTIQYLEEMTLAIQHNIGVKKFLTVYLYSLYSTENAQQQLGTVTNLFSERNRLDTQEPFVEKVYLFREAHSISDHYYPTTVSEMKKDEEKYSQMNQRFLAQEEPFYYEVEKQHVNLCLNLYDEDMAVIGSCIFVLNRAGLEAIYSNLDKLERCGWAVRQGEETILSRGSQTVFGKGTMEHTMKTGFGLTLYAAISPWQAYRTLVTTALILMGISISVILVISLVGYMMARYFVSPLETIAEKINLVGKGNFSAKLGEYRAEELNNISEKFNEMADYINVLVTEVYETQMMATRAQIKYLQAQMNPHFLFNVLSMIEMKAAINGDMEVQRMLFKLSRLYQGKIFRREQYFIRLAEEMEVVEFYLSLQNSRFGDKITYSIEYVGERKDYEKCLVPRLSIEPSVENAICHGLEPKEGNGHIHIRVSFEEAEKLLIVIEDDGVGFDLHEEERKEDKGHNQVGIYNTDRMIKNLCGENYGMEISSRQGEGTVVVIRLPIRKKEEKREDNHVESAGGR